MKSAHLVRVMVQTVWVVVDDEDGTAEDFSDQLHPVSAKDWPGFYEKHTEEFNKIKAKLASEQEKGSGS